MERIYTAGTAHSVGPAETDGAEAAPDCRRPAQYGLEGGLGLYPAFLAVTDRIGASRRRIQGKRQGESRIAPGRFHRQRPKESPASAGFPTGFFAPGKLKNTTTAAYPTIGPSAMLLAVHIGAFADVSVWLANSKMTVPLAIHKGAFKDIPIWEANGPMAIRPVAHNGAFRNGSV